MLLMQVLGSLLCSPLGLWLSPSKVFSNQGKYD